MNGRERRAIRDAIVREKLALKTAPNSERAERLARLQELERLAESD